MIFSFFLLHIKSYREQCHIDSIVNIICKKFRVLSNLDVIIHGTYFYTGKK